MRTVETAAVSSAAVSSDGTPVVTVEGNML